MAIYILQGGGKEGKFRKFNTNKKIMELSCDYCGIAAKSKWPLKIDCDEKLENVAHNGKDTMVNSAGCSTPTAKRYRIPEILSCPSAPKKRRVAAAAADDCLSKRSTSIAFFAPPDIEVFFFSAFQKINFQLEMK